jgi:hypothetical protein
MLERSWSASCARNFDYDSDSLPQVLRLEANEIAIFEGGLAEEVVVGLAHVKTVMIEHLLVDISEVLTSDRVRSDPQVGRVGALGLGRYRAAIPRQIAVGVRSMAPC